MNKLDRLIKIAKETDIVMPYTDYDFSKLTSAELYELISEDITEDRMSEILEPVRFTSTDASSTRKTLEKLTCTELEEMTVFYERINEG